MLHPIEIVVPQNGILEYKVDYKTKLYVKSITNTKIFFTADPIKAKRVSTGVVNILAKCLSSKRKGIKLKPKRIIIKGGN